MSLLDEWGRSVHDATLLGAAADQEEERETPNWPLVFALRWMLMNERRPGRRALVRRPWTWIFDVRLRTDDRFHRKIRLDHPHAVLPRSLYPHYTPHYVSFPTPAAAVLWLAGSLDGLNRITGHPPSSMPTRPYGVTRDGG